MSPENQLSPFAALSYKEQQDRWLEWRSRQLDYRAVSAPVPEEESPFSDEPTPELPTIQLPRLHSVAPTRHRELDQLWARHKQALRHAGTFHSLNP